MFKQIQLIISFLQEFFNGFIQIFNILTTSTQSLLRFTKNIEGRLVTLYNEMYEE